MKKILADRPDYRVTLHQAGPAPAERLVITFGGQPSGIRDDGFGTDFCLRQGWDTIYVAQRHGTQYQGLSLAAFADAVGPVCQGRDVVTYGPSLGGYAALYYGGVIDARIIAAAPMLPAWPAFGHKAYRDLDLTHHDLADGPRARRAPTVILDPRLRNDARILAEMVRPAYPDVRVVEVPHAGHAVLIPLQRARVLGPLIVTLIEQDQIIAFTPPGAGTSIYHGQRGQELLQRDRIAAIEELRLSLSIEPNKRFFGILVNALIRSGQLAEAQAELDRAAATSDRRLTLTPRLTEDAAAAGLRLQLPLALAA